jgi:hypothetical protein
MPEPIMFTEAVFLLSPEFAPHAKRRCPSGKQFERFMQLQGVDREHLDPAALQKAAERCTRCACRKACRHWLRTGAFAYAGDPRCPNAGLLRN